MKNARLKIFLVDDDRLYLKVLANEFNRKDDFVVEVFETGELCIEGLVQNPDVIILDYHLNGIVKEAMNGIQTLDRIKLINPAVPVVMLSSQDKIDVAVSCMHHKAFDYVVKNETAFFRLQKIIELIQKLNSLESELTWYMSRM